MMMMWHIDVWDPRGFHADFVATSDKTEIKTTEGPKLNGFAQSSPPRRLGPILKPGPPKLPSSRLRCCACPYSRVQPTRPKPHRRRRRCRRCRRRRRVRPCGNLGSSAASPSLRPRVLCGGLRDAPTGRRLRVELAMQAVGTAAAFSPAVTPSPARRRAVDSGRRFSRSCRSGRVSVSAAGYSQLEVRRVSYRPPGTEQNLLNEISLNLKEKSFGLLFGRSGSGKTTLLQLLAGLSEPTHGTICIQKYNDSGNPMGPPELLTAQRVGIVFQFPERFELPLSPLNTVLEEITFGWPRQNTDFLFREKLALKLQNAINSVVTNDYPSKVGLNGISLEEDPQSLSGGFKRRLALAIQLVQTPDLLLLDEPLAGLDWKARADVVNLLKDLKKDHTILAVSHDLRELYPLVDRSWRMEMGGVLKEEALSVKAPGSRNRHSVCS
uniref:ABC transporter domain-containing protein n=1 Tax=Oryza barthii TaxID=65489 RepID=A0A0D3HLX7_9ORYZ